MIALFLNTSKGLFVLEQLIQANLNRFIKGVVSYNDKNTHDDSYASIKKKCIENAICFHDKNDNFDFKNIYKLAIGWQFIIQDTSNLFVIHDSILPKYRGFAPIVNALINGEEKIGASLIESTSKYDKGEIFKQETIMVTYPIKIAEAIKLIEVAYSNLTVSFFNQIISNKPIVTVPQIEENATYSLWRNSEDYFIDWSLDSKRIKRVVDALGFPYNKAKTTLNGQTYCVDSVEIVTDVKIENRIFGRQIFVEDNCPVIVCGKGLIKLKEVTDIDSNTVLFKQFRNQFK